ncbi:MAG TPA: rhodanese-like domain-containing protein [Candidatus Paceibacterota bacterium]|nr:rhodanese-like domain-containing protein [Candidatus Paceibacterota bacterium]
MTISGRMALVYALGAVVVTALAIYLTPLKWITLVEPTIWDIDPHEFQADFAANPDEYIFIDVRPEAPYKAIHAAGSINMPLHTLYDMRHALPKRGKTIVLICSGGRASGVAYHYLQHFGFFNIRRIEGGIENWVLAGLPVEGTQASSRVVPPAE